MKWKGWINGILGLWLVTSVFLGLGSAIYTLNDISVGIIVLMVNFSIVHDKSWSVWITSIFALWLIFSAFIPDLVRGIGLYFNNIFVGMIFLIAGFVIWAHAERLPQHSRLNKYYNYLNYGRE
jgi:hypothetical protein